MTESLAGCLVGCAAVLLIVTALDFLTAWGVWFVWHFIHPLDMPSYWTILLLTIAVSLILGAIKSSFSIGTSSKA